MRGDCMAEKVYSQRHRIGPTTGKNDRATLAVTWANTMNSTTIHLDMYEYANIDNFMDYIATAALTVWTLGFLWFITSPRNNQIPPPPFYRRGAPVVEATSDEEEEQQQSTWKPIGIYNLNKPQTLTKKEREALDAVGGGNASYLFEKTHASGKKSWRYGIGETWFYPTETAVRRRGLDLFGNHTNNLVD